MDPSTILACVVAGVAVFFFCAGAGAVHLWLSERIAWRDETLRTVRAALEREHQEARVAADSRRDMALGDEKRAAALQGAGPDDPRRLERVLDLFGPRGQPAPPAAAAAADTSGGRATRPNG